MAAPSLLLKLNLPAENLTASSINRLRGMARQSVPPRLGGSSVCRPLRGLDDYCRRTARCHSPDPVFHSCGGRAQASAGVRKTNLNRAIEDMKMCDFLIEAIDGLPTIKASAMESQMQRRFERRQEAVAAHSFTSMRLAEETQAFGNLPLNLLK